MPLSSLRRKIEAIKARASNTFFESPSTQEVEALEEAATSPLQNTRIAGIAAAQIVGSLALAVVYLLVTHTKF